MQPDIINQTHYFYNQHGYKVFYQFWKSVISPPTRVACIVHGLGEHSERYEEMARFLTKWGFVTYAMDLYGFGRAEGKRGDVKRIEDYIKDLKTFQAIISKSEEVKKEVKNEKSLLLGHSMGGLLALAYLETYPEDYLNAIISAPWLNPRDNVSNLKFIIAKLLNILAPSFAFSNKINPEDISTDPEVQEYLLENELVHDRITSRLYIGVTNLAEKVKINSHKINSSIKILFIHGKEDRIIPPETSLQFYKSLSHIRDKQIEIIEGMRHETHTDLHREKSYAVLEGWLNQHFSMKARGGHK